MRRSNSLKTNSFLVGETLSKCQNLAPASSTTQDTATHWKPQSVAVFLCAWVSCGVPKFAPISHGIRTDHLDAATRALIVSAYKATGLAVTTLSMMDVERRKRSPVPKTKKSPAEPGLKWIRETRVSRGSKETTGCPVARAMSVLSGKSLMAGQSSHSAAQRCFA